MLIDLGEKLEYEVKYSGQVYKLQEPTATDVEKMQKAEGSEIDKLIDFLSGLGLPEDVGRSLGLSKIKTLTDALTKELSEKK